MMAPLTALESLILIKVDVSDVEPPELRQPVDQMPLRSCQLVKPCVEDLTLSKYFYFGGQCVNKIKIYILSLTTFSGQPTRSRLNSTDNREGVVADPLAACDNDVGGEVDSTDTTNGIVNDSLSDM